MPFLGQMRSRPSRHLLLWVISDIRGCFSCTIGGVASTGEVWKLGHRPALDGIRGIAVLLVVVCHATELYVPPLRPLGRIGVGIFFVLSGFLITSLLLEERAREGRLDLAAFYLRRARRLLPALVAVLVVVGGLGMATWSAIAAVAFYYGNWFGAAGNSLGWLPHTWSLAIEEQFYLLWPLVVGAVQSKRALLAVAIGGSGASVLMRLLLWDGTGARADDLGWWTHTAADPILLGCALAVAMHGSRVRHGAAWGAGPQLVAAILMGALGGWAWRTVGMPTAVAVLTCGAIWCVVHTSEVRCLSGGGLAALGRRSYGLYLWHVPVLSLCGAFGLTPIAHVTTGVVLSFALAWVSWRWVEQPFLRLNALSHGRSRSARRETRPMPLR